MKVGDQAQIKPEWWQPLVDECRRHNNPVPVEKYGIYTIERVEYHRNFDPFPAIWFEGIDSMGFNSHSWNILESLDVDALIESVKEEEVCHELV